MKIPTPIIVALATCILGIVSVFVGSKFDAWVGLLLPGVLLIAIGGLGTTGLFIYYLIRPPNVDLAPGEKSGLPVRILGICMFVCGIGWIVGFLVHIINGPRPDGPKIIVIWLGLPVLLLYGGWQMMTGKV